MIFVRCDRCQKEIPFSEKFHRIKVMENKVDGGIGYILHGQGDGRIIELCDRCMSGINLYLQGKINSYADLTRT